MSGVAVVRVSASGMSALSFHASSHLRVHQIGLRSMSTQNQRGPSYDPGEARLHALFANRPRRQPAPPVPEVLADEAVPEVVEETSGGSLDFQNSALAFASKSNFELVRTWAVFQTCAIGPIVRYCDTLYNLGCKFPGETVTHFILRHTFFNHFCAGENVEDIKPRMSQLAKLGVGGILDYAAEAKDDDDGTKAEAPAAEESEDGATLSAKTYTYEGEAACDANAEIFLEAIRNVRDATPDGFAAIKLSGLGNPVLLERMSTCLVEITRLFYLMSKGKDISQIAEDRKTPFFCIDRSFEMDFPCFQSVWSKLFAMDSEDDLRAEFSKFDANGDGHINYLEWINALDLADINALVRTCREQGPLYRAALDSEEIKLYMNMLSRVDKIMDFAQESNIRVMVDAEWMDIQPAIDHLVHKLQFKYNTGGTPIVFNTYQTYLKGMSDRVKLDLVRSQNEGWRFGAKVVRGAYMVSEREKAKNRGVDSPICESYEDTEQNYHRSIEAILKHNTGMTGEFDQEKPGRTVEAEVLVASHSRASIEFTLNHMVELKKDPNLVGFGQLLGMADHLTFTLGANGYKAYKYIPYGPIDEVVPYLIRRTQENSAILGSAGVQEERRMVQSELRRRLFGF